MLSYEFGWALDIPLIPWPTSGPWLSLSGWCPVSRCFPAFWVRLFSVRLNEKFKNSFFRRFDENHCNEIRLGLRVQRYTPFLMSFLYNILQKISIHSHKRWVLCHNQKYIISIRLYCKRVISKLVRVFFFYQSNLHVNDVTFMLESFLLRGILTLIKL